MYACMYVRMYVRMYACMSACMRFCLCMCVYVYITTQICSVTAYKCMDAHGILEDIRCPADSQACIGGSMPQPNACASVPTFSSKTAVLPSRTLNPKP